MSLNWAIEGDEASPQNPVLGDGACNPCADRFNPVFVFGASLAVSGLNHLDHFVFKGEVIGEVKVTVGPATSADQIMLGAIILFTQDTDFETAEIVFEEGPGIRIITDGFPNIRANGGSVGLLSIAEDTWVLVGNNDLFV